MLIMCKDFFVCYRKSCLPNTRGVIMTTAYLRIMYPIYYIIVPSKIKYEIQKITSPPDAVPSDSCIIPIFSLLRQQSLKSKTIAQQLLPQQEVFGVIGGSPEAAGSNCFLIYIDETTPFPPNEPPKYGYATIQILSEQEALYG